MKVGVVGVGSMGKNHIRIYGESRKVSSLYVYDVNHQQASDISEKNNAIVCESLAGLLEEVDAVSICVPTRDHFSVGMKVLDAGIPLLMEKPLCGSVKEAEYLVSKIRPEMIVGVGHIERFNPIIQEISRICKKPLYIEMKRHNPGSSRILDTPVVHDLMIHDIDILRHVLTNEPFEIFAIGTDHVAAALFRTSSTSACLSASRESSKKIRQIYIEMEQFTIEGDFMTQEVYSYWKPDKYGLENERYVQENIIEKVMVNKMEPLKSELTTFLDCVKSGSPFPVTAEQACEDLRICDQIQSSL
jgi:predicted dehydrogenase